MIVGDKMQTLTFPRLYKWLKVAQIATQFQKTSGEV